MSIDLDALTREALAAGADLYDAHAIRHAIRFTLERYAPEQLPDSVKELAERLYDEWNYDGSAGNRGADLAAFIIRRVREIDGGAK